MTMTTVQRWTLALTSIASLMILLDALVVTTALHAIALNLHAGIADLEWTVNAYMLPFAVLLMAGAALGERYGRRRILVIGLAVFGIASAGCALAPSLGWLIIARAVQGVGAAGVAPTALSLVSAAFGPELRPRALGLFASVTGLATLGGPLVGGAIVQNLTWQWIFWVNVPFAAALIPVLRLRLGQESAGAPRGLDWAGIGLISTSVFGLMWGLIQGNESGWGSGGIVAALVVGVIALAAFVWWELRADVPLIPMRLFASSAFSAGNAAGFLLSASTFSAAFFLAQFLQIVMRHGPMTTGLLLLPWTATLFLVAPIAGGLVNRIGARPLVVAGLGLQAAGLGWIALVAGPWLTYPPLIAPFVISGVGISLTIPSAQSAVIEAVPATGIGAASGTFNTVRQLGGAFGIAITTAFFTAGGGLGAANTFSHGFTPAITTAAVLAFAGAVVGLVLPRRTSRATAVPADEHVSVR